MATDAAGPSGAVRLPQSASVLAEADNKFQEGISCIKDNNLERAVELFSEVLKVRTQHYGELAPECASAYYRYGSALLYQAQDNSDILGGPLGLQEGSGNDTDDKENDEDGHAPAATHAGSGGADEKGKGKVPEQEDKGGEEEDAHDAGGATDLQLAWENLETAKFIFEQQADANLLQLADVHLLLGDVGCEDEDFEKALADYDKALHYLEPHVEEGNRRVAEVQYKRCMALQFLDQPQAALEAVRSAMACLATRTRQLKEQSQAAEGEEKQRVEGELQDVGAIVEDLEEKVEELREVMDQHLTTKNALKSAMETISKLEQQAGGGARQEDPTEHIGFDKPAGGEVQTAATAAAAAPAPVRNLGVVGRGTKRLNLAPAQEELLRGEAAAAHAATPSSSLQVNGGEATAGAQQAPPAAKKKRSLEDIMGGDGGETAVCFGAASAEAKPEEGQLAAGTMASSAPAVPAFLQPQAIQAVYGQSQDM